MPDIPLQEPEDVIAGDTIQWRREDLSDDYPASTWSLTYYLRGPSQPANVTASADGDYFAITIPAATSTTYKPGTYYWQGKVSSGGETYTVGSGSFEVEINLADADEEYDGRPHVKKVLDAIEAVIERRATMEQRSYTIADKTLESHGHDELFIMRARYRRQYARWLRKQRIKQGKAAGEGLKVRF